MIFVLRYFGLRPLGRSFLFLLVIAAFRWRGCRLVAAFATVRVVCPQREVSWTEGRGLIARPEASIPEHTRKTAFFLISPPQIQS